VGVGVYGYFLNTSKGVQRRGRLWRHRGRRHLGKCQCGNRSVSFGPAEAARTQVCLYLCCRYVIGQYVTVHGDVISHVNITRVVVEDGGEYSCTAENRAGKVTHAARLNVYGKERRTRGCFGGMNTSSRASLAGPDGPRPHSFFHNDHNDHNDAWAYSRLRHFSFWRARKSPFAHFVATFRLLCTPSHRQSSEIIRFFHNNNYKFSICRSH
jgi:hypothetical protein